ncbi:Uma2 family endonuclease [Streptomyces sp. MB09-02B]|uniref:Uma2 family endonuclease n=1 Tax=Streptomyces sp. MB09-02B TaxID=3028667 RepID=UPI0029A66DAE|nr:Uma2 family endonuclease [Streptomyces sp. MB09-02B]MDX3640876.1 Uma2 family endonuclease [Streptomyces sp. MB09-02B]
MTAMAHEPLSQEDLLLEGFLALDTPEGFRAELIEGEIVVTPPPDGEHEKYISRIVRQVIKRSRTDMDFSGNKGLILRSGEACPKNHVVPVATFAPIELDLFGGARSWMPCDGVAMVVEVTSTKPAADREAKRRCYARSGIPFYLLADREASQVTLFSRPAKDDYRADRTRAFGEPLPLPEPFAFDLETSDFL